MKADLVSLEASHHAVCSRSTIFTRQHSETKGFMTTVPIHA